MNFEYIPEESDFLNYLYYVTTKSKRVQKKRAMNKLIILIIYFITGIYLYNSQGPVTSGFFFLLCLPMYFLYSYFERKQYLKHFTRYIQTSYKNEIGVKTTVSLDEEGVSISLSDSNTRIPWTEVIDISETNALVLIQDKNQNAIVIPKQKTQGIQEMIAELKRIASNRQIPYVEELNWKWK